MAKQRIHDVLGRMLLVVLAQETPENNLVAEIYKKHAKSRQLGGFS